MAPEEDKKNSDDAMKARGPEEVAAALKAAARSQVPGAVEGLISGYHPMDIAFAMRVLDSDEREAIFNVLAATDAGVVLGEVDDEMTEDLAEAADDDELAEIVDTMQPDAASDFMGLLDERRAHRVLERIPPQEAADLQELMQFEDDTAGGLMTTEVLMAPADLTVGELETHLRNQDVSPSGLTYAYIVDDDRRLLGVIDMPELVTAPTDAELEDVMVEDVVTVRPDADQERVIQLVDKYDLMGLPVVDENERLLGMVTVDDVIDAIQEEVTEDISHIAGTSTKALRTESSLRLFQLRFPWLLVTLFGTFLSAITIKYFSAPLEKVISLAVFIPVITAMTGNSGLQSATLVVRNMALGLVEFAGVGRLILREVFTAMLLGLGCGLVAGAFAAVYLGEPGFGFVVAIAMMLAMTYSVLLGTLIPFVFEWLGVDPAIASGPLITTLNDAFALIIYFAVAIIIMRLFPDLLPMVAIGGRGG